MRSSRLPPHLARALGRGFAREDIDRVVAMLEAEGCQVIVRRVQLGDPKADGFGQITEIYRTREARKDHAEESTVGG